MRRLVLPFAIVLALTAAVAASAGGGSSRPAPTVTTLTRRGPDPVVQLARAQGFTEFVSALDRQTLIDYLHARAEADVATWLASIPAPSGVVEPALPLAPAPEVSRSGGHSYAWWEAIATCESGNTNAWRTGYYGIEAGYPIGGMSKADQLAWAQRIDAQSGDGAWGCSPVAWSNVPGG